MLFATPDDVTAVQADVKAQTKALSTSLGDCIKAGKFSFSKGTANDPNLGRDWKAVLKRAIAFLDEEPGWVDAQSQYERGVRILSDLQPWYDRINSAGCEAPPKPAPPPSKPKGEDWFGDWGAMVALGLVVLVLHEAKTL